MYQFAIHHAEQWTVSFVDSKILRFKACWSLCASNKPLRGWSHLGRIFLDSCSMWKIMKFAQSFSYMMGIFGTFPPHSLTEKLVVESLIFWLIWGPDLHAYSGFSGIETHPSKWMPRDATCVAILGSGTTCGGITAKDEFVYHLW